MGSFCPQREEYQIGLWSGSKRIDIHEKDIIVILVDGDIEYCQVQKIWNSSTFDLRSCQQPFKGDGINVSKLYRLKYEDDNLTLLKVQQFFIEDRKDGGHNVDPIEWLSYDDRPYVKEYIKENRNKEYEARLDYWTGRIRISTKI